MARQEKRFELRLVDEEAEKRRPMSRVERLGPLPEKESAVRLNVPVMELKAAHRLEVPTRETSERKKNEPGIELLIETPSASPDQMEETWGAETSSYRNVPWGWFVLVGLILTGGVIWSLTRVSDADEKAAKIRVATETVLGNDAKEEMEASRLVEQIQKTTKEFFDATSINGMLHCVRQPDRLRPLMEKYYKDQPISVGRVKDFRALQPLTLDRLANYWMASVTLTNKESRNLLIEITPNGEPLVDWETLVCYQPMKWDDFAKSKPRKSALDFRVYIEQDNFFSHEFADASRWNCYRLTALDSDETLFGYSAAGSELSTTLGELLNQNSGRKSSVILRLEFPENLQSRSGVIIDKLVSPRWLYVDPPDTGS